MAEFLSPFLTPCVVTADILSRDNEIYLPLMADTDKITNDIYIFFTPFIPSL